MREKRLKIFIVHNYYQHFGGEDVVFENEVAKLSQNHVVKAYQTKNLAGFKGMLQFLKYPWNRGICRRIIKEIQEFKPDVVHIHNLHYAIGLLLLRKLNRLNIPHVHTLHNYRFLCPSATLYHEGRVFSASVKRNFPMAAVFRGVHNKSFLKTFWIAFTYYFHKKIRSWQPHTHFLVFTEFAKALFVSSTLKVPESRFYVKPNFVERPETEKKNPAIRGKHFLFVGRLSEEKGIRQLVESVAGTTLQLKILGTGPLEKEILNYAEKYPGNINFRGHQSRNIIFEEMRKASALVMPSLWYEGMPLTVLEAYATGTPVLGAHQGVLGEIIKPHKTGLIFDPQDTKSIQKSLFDWLSLENKDKISDNCLIEYEMKYSPEVVMQQLEKIYHELSNLKTK